MYSCSVVVIFYVVMPSYVGARALYHLLLLLITNFRSPCIRYYNIYEYMYLYFNFYIIFFFVLNLNKYVFTAGQ